MFEESVGYKLLPFDHPTSGEAESGGDRVSANGANQAGVAVEKSEPNEPDIASQADMLLELIDELKAITDRACNAAVRESECAERIEESKGGEVAHLEARLKESEEALAARDAALKELDERSRVRIQDLETELGKSRTQWEAREIETEDLKSNLRDLTIRLHRAEQQAREASQQLRTEMGRVERQLMETQTELETKDRQLKEAGGDLKARNQDLESRLQELGSQLESRDAELKEKERLIQAAASREMEIGKLILRLSEECKKLGAELNEKSLIVAQLEKKQRHFIGDAAVWKKVLGRVKEEAL